MCVKSKYAVQYMVHIKYTVRMYSLIPSNKTTLFVKKREKLTTKIITKMVQHQIGHGMAITLSEEQQKQQMAAETAKRKKQAEEFAKNSLPTAETTSTTIHESKHFPFQIVEITTTQGKKETKQFRIGMLGEFVSHKVFKTKETAEKYISTRPWDLITNLVCLTFKNAFEYEKSQSKH